MTLHSCFQPASLTPTPRSYKWKKKKKEEEVVVQEEEERKRKNKKEPLSSPTSIRTSLISVMDSVEIKQYKRRRRWKK